MPRKLKSKDEATPDATNEVDSLVERLYAARAAYYLGSDPLMSDAAFDALEDSLRARAPKHDYFTKVGAAVEGDLPKVRHDVPMGSLDKAQNKAELQAWWKRTLGITGHVVVMDKLDGGAVDLYYMDGNLTRAATRGDGVEGEDVTRNVMLMKGVKHQLDVKFAGHVRGETIVRKSDFAAHFPGESNPRSTANGTMQRQSEYAACRHLTVVCYAVIPDATSAFVTKTEELSWLGSRGFLIPVYHEARNTDDVEAVYQKYVSGFREQLDCIIDGLVVMVDDNEHRESFGETDSRPLGAVAYKFPHEEKRSILHAVLWQVGNSGRVTPVALFAPVLLGGASVERASLHNVGYISRLVGVHEHLDVGDEVLISRRNDVIPYVEALIAKSPNKEPLRAPTTCPSCAAPLVMEGEYLVCHNSVACPAQLSGAIKRWVAKVGVLEWGDALVDALCTAGMVKDVSDLYRLDAAAIASVQLSGRRLGESSACKAVNNLRAKMELSLATLVGSLGIELWGCSMVQLLVDAKYDTLDKLGEVGVMTLENVPGVGSIKAEAFVLGFRRVLPVIRRLLARGVTVLGPRTGTMAGEAVLFTGFRDPRLSAAIEAAGGTVKSGWSKAVTIVVAKDTSGSSSKLEAARKAGAKILNITEMKAALNAGKGR